MKRFYIGLAAVFALAVSTASADPQETGPVAPGGNVVIDARSDRNLTVQLKVVAWDKNEVQVDQTHESDPEAHIRPSVVQRGTTTNVAPLGSGVRKSYFFGLFSWGGSSVSWTVYVPSRTPLAAYTDNSGVEVAGVEGALTIRTSNGGITVDGAGPMVDVDTSNGGVGVKIASLQSRAPEIRIHTSNGPVSLRVPPDFHTRIRTQTYNGQTANPFADAGGPGNASITTSNGGIEVTASR